MFLVFQTKKSQHRNANSSPAFGGARSVTRQLPLNYPSVTAQLPVETLVVKSIAAKLFENSWHQTAGHNTQSQIMYDFNVSAFRFQD
jgi:hypothetical protein